MAAVVRYVATILLASSCIALSAAPSSNNRTFGPSEEAARQNAFAIFNAVHSAFRQWGSSLNHNGLSAFLVTVPEGVVLHHGTSSPNPPPGPEWLAFEIEHAELFARPRREKCPTKYGCPPYSKPTNHHPSLHHSEQQQQLETTTKQFTGETLVHQHEPPADEHDDSDSDYGEHGYLHLYRTTAPLRLLYLDGMSAGNTAMGTLDLQDLVLRGERDADIMDEQARAAALCALLAADWGLHGVLRMEAGFEIIKCAPFLDGMELLEANRRPERRPGLSFGGGGGGGGGGAREGPGGGTEGYTRVHTLELVRALAQRYHGIGGGRVVVDYSSMVSGLFYDVNLTNPDASRAALPRLVGLSDGELRGIKERVEEVVRARREGGKRVVDWQGVTDLIVARYADRLMYMAWHIDALEDMQGEVNALLNTYIDYGAEDKGFKAATARCSKHYTRTVRPETLEDGVILTALETVTFRICRVLFDVRELVVGDTKAGEEAFTYAKLMLRGLMDQLRWTRWKECLGCGYHEVCFVPMWPFGDKDSYERPNCRNATSIQNGWRDNGYWEWPRRRRPGHGQLGEDVEDKPGDL
ncbi:hypothetical protein N656DRAFT_845315 [Canariomyces notabilis]|uniref:Uncharacterized protein n=1 Tax=Canariomyces notabilis TaxID=2074819 RepID=A0AAN6TDS8_9PEZI|nr:hypothetical protein N656DRAFT_845315 [Canariomyces arenarius]